MRPRGHKSIAGQEKMTPEQVKQRNLDSYGSKIKAFRKRAGLTAEELAEQLRLSKSSVRNWECGLTRPDPEFLYRMFSILDVEPNEFFGIKGIGSILTPAEQQLVNDYRTLDDAGKEDAETFLKAMSEKAYRRKLLAAYDRMNGVEDFGRYASAGKGEDWPDYPEVEETILYNSPIVSRSDEIITISGQSMEPQFHDGDKVLVMHCTELRNGDIGIFYVPGMGGVIKQKAYDRLHSINPDYDDIFPYEEGARIIGKVLGKIEEEMLPGYEEQKLFLEAVEEIEELHS